MYLGSFFLIASILGNLVFPAPGESNATGTLNEDDRKLSRPNIIVILADDLGYGDLGGFYGGEARTPNLDRMANEGMLFTDFHSNGPMCSPTRAALLTGRYQQRLGIERALPTDWGDRGIGSEENRNELTIADYVRRRGYVTGAYGKWHLGKHPSANPVHHGFDDFRGLTCGCGDYFSKVDRNGYRDWWHNDKLDFQEGYATDVITDNSVNFIRENNGRPFFLYVAYSAIHFPWQTAEDYNLETRREGADYTNNNPGPKSKLGPHTTDQVPAMVRNMIERLDVGIGKIMNELKQQGIDGETIVVFTSDNGGYQYYNKGIWPAVSSNGPLRGQKGQVYEGGHRVPAIARWPGKIPAGIISHETVMTFDLLPTFLELLQVPSPKEGSANIIDGKSLTGVLFERKALTSRPIFWRMADQKAVRYGDWKLVIAGPDATPELYNLRMDIGEVTNLATEYPIKVKELISKLDSWEMTVTGSKSK